MQLVSISSSPITIQLQEEFGSLSYIHPITLCSYTRTPACAILATLLHSKPCVSFLCWAAKTVLQKPSQKCQREGTITSLDLLFTACLLWDEADLVCPNCQLVLIVSTSTTGPFLQSCSSVSSPPACARLLTCLC